jgi:hypothetical protein
MTTDFLTFNEDEYNEFVTDICVEAKFTENDLDKVLGVCDWVHNTIINATLLSMVREKIIRISDCSGAEGVTFEISDEFRNANQHLFPDENSVIWQEISRILEAKDEQNSPN